MIHIDHVCLGTQNVHEGSYRLTQETGLGCYDGGFFPGMGLSNRIFPTGGDTYIEVEGVSDAYVLAKGNPICKFFYDKCRDGDVFIGWCARVDSRDELDRLAKRLDAEVVEGGLRRRPDGSMGISARAPETMLCWEAGLPNFFHIADMAGHPGRGRAEYGTKAAQSIAWLEVGGTEEEMSDHLGMKAGDLGLRFNGQKHGLYAMGISTDRGEVVIRRPVLSGTSGKISKVRAYL